MRQSTVPALFALGNWTLFFFKPPCILQSLVWCRVLLEEYRSLDSGRRLQFRIRRLLRQWIRLLRQFWRLLDEFPFLYVEVDSGT